MGLSTIPSTKTLTMNGAVWTLAIGLVMAITISLSPSIWARVCRILTGNAPKITDFRHRVVCITGAGSGIGLALARAFKREGAYLCLNDNDRPALEAVERELGAAVKVAHAFDVSNEKAMKDFAEACGKIGGSSVIINNAGIGGCVGTFLNVPQEKFERTLNINFWGVVYGTRCFLPQILKQPNGCVVNISSAFALVPSIGSLDYVCSKYAVRGLTEMLACSDLQDTNVSVHCVHPGGINTNIIKSAMNDHGPDASAHLQIGSKLMNKQLKTTPDSLATHIISGIKRGETRIVYGHRAFEFHMLMRLVPFAWTARLIRSMERKLTAIVEAIEKKKSSNTTSKAQ